MLTTFITTICIFCIGFVGGAAWKGIFKREDDASARIDSPRTIEDAARWGGV